MTILFFAANADKTRLLAIEQEHDAIAKSIDSSRRHEPFRLVSRMAGRLSDLHQALLDHKPDILHFACHGSAQAELLLMQDGDAAAPVPAAALAETLRVLGDNLVLVVFNACFSSEQAEAIRENVGLAIGMERPIHDKAAVLFAEALYRGQASGLSVQDAFVLGVAALQSTPSPDPSPKLWSATDTDPAVVYLARETGRAQRWVLGGAIGLAVALVAAAVAIVELPSPPPPAMSLLPPAPPGMAAFPGAAIRMGVFAEGSRPASCASLTADEDCAVLAHPESIAPTPVAPFYLDQLEVTNGEFAAWMNASPDLWALPNQWGIVWTQSAPGVPLIRTAKCGDGLTITPEGRAQVSAESARRPVVCVAWQGADAYCRAQGKRLPLESEWELAAKGAEGRPFPWGAELPRPDSVFFNRRGSAAAHPGFAGESPQDVTPDGVHDLGGNAAEWVEDERGDLAVKTVRGGSFGSRGPCYLLGSGCQRAKADSYRLDLGFRCARSALVGREKERAR